MIDMNWIVNSVWAKEVVEAELFQSTGRATGGQFFIKLHFDPPSFPSLVLGDLALDWAWVQLGNSVCLTEDGSAWRPRPERPSMHDCSWLNGKVVEFRLELKEFTTKWRGEKAYLAPRFLKLRDPVK